MSGEKQENGMDKREKVMRGLECCYNNNCGACPYAAIIKCQFKLHSDALALLREYDTALKLMVFQYCNYEEGFYHKFMSAGEEAFRVLGIENGQSTNGIWEKWFQTNERGEDNA